MTYFCWRCTNNPVTQALDDCQPCRWNDYQRYRRWNQGRENPTADSTHQAHRAPLEAADWHNTGKRPQHKGSE